jgi:hypothetical protein
MSNPFAEKYKTLSTAQLLEIIDTPENYQPLAITAAEDELLDRNPYVAEMTEARAENGARNAEKEAKSEKKKSFEDKIINVAGSVIETISPVQKTPSSLNRVILLISIVFALLGLFRLYTFYDESRYLLADNYRMVLNITLPALFEGIYLLGTAFMFWKKMKWGWIFLVVYLFFAPVGAFIMFAIELWRSHFPFSASAGLMQEYTRSALFGGLFFGSCIWFAYKRSVKEVYKIDKYLGILAASAGAFLALLVLVFALHR